MIRYFLSFSFLILIYFIYGFALSQKDLTLVPLVLKKENPANFYDYRGVLNVQSSRGRGFSDPKEIIAEARKAGIDFLIFTDDLKEAGPNLSGYQGPLLVLDEVETSYLDMRLIYLNPQRKDLRVQSNLFFTDLVLQNPPASDDLLFLADPLRPNPSWNGDFPTGVHGLEIINPKRMAENVWRQSKLSVFLSFLIYPFNPQIAFARLFLDPTDEINLWDRINSQRKMIGFAGSNANAKAIPLANTLVKFPSYQKSFEIFSNHVLLESELTGHSQNDASKILQAFQRGQFYFSFDLVGDPKGFECYLQQNKNYFPGAQVHWNKGTRIRATLPAEPQFFYEIVVFKNGDRVFTTNEKNLDYLVKGPGNYRVIVRSILPLPFPDGKKWVTWIYVNPFYVK